MIGRRCAYVYTYVIVAPPHTDALHESRVAHIRACVYIRVYIYAHIYADMGVYVHVYARQFGLSLMY